ncbi:MAG: TRAP transporter large permease [Anaerotruncus sp.]|nr:TRAP transporter large permease [Anaerotruncus sp.]
MALFMTVGILIITLLIGVPIPFCFGASVISMVYTLGYSPDSLLASGYTQISSVVLLAMPLFILSGGIMEKGKIGDALVNVVEKFVGRFKGGIGAVAIIASAVFGSISGSASATLSCIGSIMVPKLKENRYPTGVAASLIANASPLGLLIPPSSAQILYAWSSGQSVLACFLSTIVPGIVLVMMLCIVNFFLVRNCDLKKAENETASEWIRDTGVKAGKAIPAMLMPVIILGGIYSGIMTPTESAAVAILYSIPVGFFVYRGLTRQSFKEAIIETATTTGVVMVMFFMVMVLSKLFVMENLPTIIMEMLLSVSDNKYVLLILINVFMVIIGMLMDDTSGMLLCTPILMPIIVQLGVHPIHFAAIIGVNLGMGNITPPTAPLLYLGGRIGGAKINEMMKPTLAFLFFAWIPTLLVTTFIPELALTIPKLILPKLFM